MSQSSSIETLGLGGHFWPILALDHGLTGYVDAIDISSIPGIVTACGMSFGAVVANYGVARAISVSRECPNLIVQCFGAPFGFPKVKVCDVVSAIRIGASGIAVQIDYSATREDIQRQFREISSTVQEAHREGLAVLFMIAFVPDQTDAELLQSLRFSQELGADLIKVRVGLSQLERIASEVRSQREVASGTPVLLAGGPMRDDIFDEVARAKAAGFKGYCVGRNVFNAAAPEEVAAKLLTAWYNN